jgi:hypothetical protein
MPVDDAHPTTETTDPNQENSSLRNERDEYRNALYAVLWQHVTPPTIEELAAAEPARPWLDELIERLEKSDGD